MIARETGVVVLDHGRETYSREFLAAYEKQGVRVVRTPVWSPANKGAVERAMQAPRAIAPKGMA